MFGSQQAAARLEELMRATECEQQHAAPIVIGASHPLIIGSNNHIYINVKYGTPGDETDAGLVEKPAAEPQITTSVATRQTDVPDRQQPPPAE